MGKCMAKHDGHDDLVRGLVFTPDGNGLLTASWDKMVILWDVSWLKTHGDDGDGQKEVISPRDSTGGLTEISRFVGHTVRPLFTLFFSAPLSHNCRPFLYALEGS